MNLSLNYKSKFKEKTPNKISITQHDEIPQRFRRRRHCKRGWHVGQKVNRLERLHLSTMRLHQDVSLQCGLDSRTFQTQSASAQNKSHRNNRRSVFEPTDEHYRRCSRVTQLIKVEFRWVVSGLESAFLCF